MIRKFLEWFSSKFPKYTIPQEDGTDYLTRFYLFLTDRVLFNIYLHKFHADDFDKDIDGTLLFHNHPNYISFSFILCGGYIEYRMKETDESYMIKIRNPFSFNFINRNIFHRVELIEKDAWSIFFTFKRLGTWYFFNPKTKNKIHYTSKAKAIA